jgi:hypothetical protein
MPGPSASALACVPITCGRSRRFATWWAGASTERRQDPGPSSSCLPLLAQMGVAAQVDLRGRTRYGLPDHAAGPPGSTRGQHRHLAGPGRAGALQPCRARHRQRRGPGRRRNQGAPEFAAFDAIVVSAAYLACHRRWAPSPGRRECLVQPVGSGAANMSSCPRRSRTACGGCGSWRRRASSGLTVGTVSPSEP